MQLAWVWMGCATGQDYNEPHCACWPQGWLRDPVTLRVGPQGVPGGLQHRYMVVEEPLKLIAMCRQLRVDLRQCAPCRPMSSPPCRGAKHAALSEYFRNAVTEQLSLALLSAMHTARHGRNTIESLHAGLLRCRQGQDVAPARVMLFVRDEAAARAAARPLRHGLWGDHTVSVLLPHGEEPIQARPCCSRCPSMSLSSPAFLALPSRLACTA